MRNLKLSSPFISLCLAHTSLFFHINFISDNTVSNRLIRISMLNKVFSPFINIIETRGVRHVIHQNTRIRSPVERARERLKSFLPCSVPNLHRHRLPIKPNLLRHKVSPNRRLVLTQEHLLLVLVDQTCLPHA